MTNDNLAQPHDSLAKFFLQYADVATDLLKHYLPPEVADVFDFDDFHYKATAMVDNALGQQVADIRYATRFKGTGRPAFADIYVEHQSTLAKKVLCYRQFQYLAGGMREHFREAEASGNGFGDFTFPCPVAVILYHGAQPWGDVVQMGSLIDPMPGNERELLYFPVYLIDLSVRKFDELSGKPAVRALLTALKAAGAKRLDDELETIFGALNDESDDARFLDWLRALVIYVFRQIDSKPERVDRVLDRMKKSKEATTMATSLMERLLLEGEVKGEAKMLIRALERRFGVVAPELRERIGSCPNTERLEAWLDLAMSTSSLAEFTEKMG